MIPRAPVTTAHKNTAAHAAGVDSWRVVERCGTPRERQGVLAHAQSIADAQAMAAVLADVYRIASRVTDVAAHSPLAQVAAAAAPYRAADTQTEEMMAAFRRLPLHGSAGCDKLTNDEWALVAQAARAVLRDAE